jgi:ubiquinone/menaquinone biosynthesis C-methylase UbiE
MHSHQLLNDRMYAAAAQGGFGCPRGLWGALIGYSMAWTHRARNRWTLSLLDLQVSDRVLEIGCGPGAAIHDIAKVVTSGFVAGIDPSEVMVRQASRRNRDAIRQRRVEVQLASMSAVPYADHSFDKVFGTNSIQFSRALLSDLSEVRRLLRPGGLAAFSIQPMWRGGTVAAAREIVRNLTSAMGEAGFVNCRVEEKPAWPRTIVCALGNAAKWMPRWFVDSSYYGGEKNHESANQSHEREPGHYPRDARPRKTGQQSRTR